MTRDGLVQRVTLGGPGDYRVTFTYSPTPAWVGILISAVASGGLVLWGLVEVAVRWRHRRRVGRSGPAPAPGPE